jgi:hypothetical protein
MSLLSLFPHDLGSILWINWHVCSTSIVDMATLNNSSSDLGYSLNLMEIMCISLFRVCLGFTLISPLCACFYPTLCFFMMNNLLLEHVLF